MSLPARVRQPPRPAVAPQAKVLAGIAMVVALGFGIVGPALPLFAERFGVGHSVTGLAISVFGFFRSASALANGRLVEQYGERQLLAAGLALQSITTVAAGLAPNFALVIALRGAGGLGSAAFTVSALSLVLRTSSPDTRARAASLYQGGFLVGAVGGPALGGFLAEVNPRLAFFAYGCLLGVAGGIGMAMLRDPSARSTAGRTDHGIVADSLLAERSAEGLEIPQDVAAHLTDASAKELGLEPRLGVRSRAFAAALLLNFGSGWVLYGLRNSLVPIYGTAALGHSATWVGTVFLIASAVQVVVLMRAGAAGDTWGRRPLMIAGAVAGLLACVALAQARTGSYVLAMAAMGISAACLATAPPAVVGDVTTGGRGVAVFSMASDLGAIIGPIVGGLLADRVGYGAAFSGGIAIFALATAGCVIMPETGRPTRRLSLRR